MLYSRVSSFSSFDECVDDLSAVKAPFLLRVFVIFSKAENNKQQQQQRKEEEDEDENDVFNSRKTILSRFRELYSVCE